MIIYKDIFTEDELASDACKMKLVDGVVLEFEGKFVKREEGDIQLAGSNASAEEEAEGTETHVQQGIDIVLNHSLLRMEVYEDAKQFKSYIKEYMKKLEKKLVDDGKSAEEVADWKKKMQTWVVSLLGKERFKTLEFYQGSGEEAADGQLAILEYRRNEADDEVPTIMLINAGVVPEKV